MSNSDAATLEQNCNEELVKIDNWFKANMRTTNFKKASNFMSTLGNTDCKEYDFSLKMGNSKLDRLTKVKYLGVV